MAKSSVSKDSVSINHSFRRESRAETFEEKAEPKRHQTDVRRLTSLALTTGCQVSHSFSRDQAHRIVMVTKMMMMISYTTVDNFSSS